MTFQQVCVYCASSRQADPLYAKAAWELGQIFAANKITVVYGGGASGSMGALADGALAAGGKVVGIIPQFMVDLEWGHPQISELIIVETMHERKAQMIAHTDAVIALPGGSGTLEELLEAISWKRLGLYLNPIILVNTKNFFSRFIDLLDHCVAEKFMSERHQTLWSVVDTPQKVIAEINNTKHWPTDAR